MSNLRDSLLDILLDVQQKRIDVYTAADRIEAAAASTPIAEANTDDIVEAVKPRMRHKWERTAEGWRCAKCDVLFSIHPGPCPGRTSTDAPKGDRP
jgi:hypothetical protein